MTHPYKHGWYQIAYLKELVNEITPLAFADTRVIAIKKADQVRVFDANCPHRGAHLGYNTCFEGQALVCPFHGYRIGLGSECGEAFWVSEYQSFVIGEMVFIRLSNQDQPDFPQAIKALAKDHSFISGFDIEVNVPIEIVIENGFDQGHFKGVHGLLEEPNLAVSKGELGELAVRGEFKIPRTSWNKPSATNEPVITEFFGRAFSPGTIIVSLRGEEPYNYHIITSAIPLPGAKRCLVRLNLALPHKYAEDQTFIAALLEASKIGLSRDQAVWNHLLLDFQARLTESDKAVIAFHEYCGGFMTRGD